MFEIIDACPNCGSEEILVDTIQEIGECQECGSSFGGAAVWQ